MPTCGDGSVMTIPGLDKKGLNYSYWDINAVWVYLKGPTRVRQLRKSNDCEMCPPGYYSREKDDLFCEPAPVGFYTERPGMSEPRSCHHQFPHYATVEGSSRCDGIFLNSDDLTRYTTFFFMVGLYFLMLLCAGGQKFIAILFFSVGPALDLIGDVVTILSTPFFNRYLFYFCCTFVVLPNVGFVMMLIEIDAPCILFTLYPSYKDHALRLNAVFRGQQVSCGVLDFLAMIGFVIWMFISIILWSPVFLPGCFFYQSKVIAIKAVWDNWMFFWTFSNAHKMEDFEIDTELLNESLFHEFIYETMPQLILQAYNANLTGQWTPFQLFNTSMSAFMTMNGLWTFGYWHYYRGLSFDQIPAKSAILFFIELELESNYQIAQRKDLKKFYNRICSRKVRVTKYESKMKMKRFELKLKNRLGYSLSGDAFPASDNTKTLGRIKNLDSCLNEMSMETESVKKGYYNNQGKLLWCNGYFMGTDEIVVTEILYGSLANGQLIEWWDTSSRPWRRMATIKEQVELPSQIGGVGTYKLIEDHGMKEHPNHKPTEIYTGSFMDYFWHIPSYLIYLSKRCCEIPKVVGKDLLQRFVTVKLFFISSCSNMRQWEHLLLKTWWRSPPNDFNYDDVLDDIVKKSQSKILSQAIYEQITGEKNYDKIEVRLIQCFLFNNADLVLSLL